MSAVTASTRHQRAGLHPDNRHLNKNKHIEQACSCNGSDDCSKSLYNGRDDRKYLSKPERGENQLGKLALTLFATHPDVM